MSIQGLEDQLSGLLQGLLRAAEPSGEELDRLLQDHCRWEMPKDPSFGDLSNSAAFKLAARRKQPPQRLAEELAQGLLASVRSSGLGRLVERVDARSGFLNVVLSPAAMAEVLRAILSQGPRYGARRQVAPVSVNVEFVSANPTGPLSVAHGRQAAVGDVLTRLLRSQGCRVTAEYYLNDEGRQIEMLGHSLRARCLQVLGKEAAFPEEGYHGAYVTESASRLAKELGELAAEKPLDYFMERGMKEQLEEIQRVLSRFGLAFDRWTSQRWLRTSGRIDAVLKTLQERGALYESEGALWFASTRFGDDKDRVVRKRDGELTYLAPDIAYHQWKLQEGYDRLVNLWGPDHHGYIARVKAAMAALGLPAERLDVRIVQLVRLSRGGTPVPMSKRQGEFVTFSEILDEVGVDATRFFYLMRTMESQLDFDLELAKSQSQDNPVYYIQYAHARICSILAKARLPWWTRFRTDFSRLREPEERVLMHWLFQYPMVLRVCALAFEPHGLTVYLRKLAESFHVFYTKHRVISEDAVLSAARLALIRAARQVFANGLGILGIGAPTRM